jgi:hypothetical protein
LQPDARASGARLSLTLQILLMRSKSRLRLARSPSDPRHIQEQVVQKQQHSIRMVFSIK